jgi:hypothetical protein
VPDNSAEPSSLNELRLRLLSLLDQKVGREKSILRRTISALDRLIREKERAKRAEKQKNRGYPDNQ